jgi:hypothetical protein
MYKENNIPAFPFVYEDKPDRVVFTGMTLRDYFAAAALTGYISNGTTNGNAVLWSYEAADKMLAKREETNK